MDIYLAQLQSELPAAANTAWLVCPFIPNFQLPEPPSGGILIFTDSSPYGGQCPEDILQGKGSLFTGSPGLVLDFQRPAAPEVCSLVASLRKALPCPVAAPPEYAGAGPVFLPPLKPHIPPENQLELWKGREIWLDLSPCPTELILTNGGCQERAGYIPHTLGFAEKDLLCHYRIDLSAENEARFTLWRTREDLLALAQQAGVTHCVALAQEWG